MIRKHKNAIVFVGDPGVGKTTLAKELSASLKDYEFISSTYIRQKNNLFNIFSEQDRLLMYRLIINSISIADKQLKNGIILDSNLLESKSREILFKFLKQLKFNIHCFFMHAKEDEIQKRIEKKLASEFFYLRACFSAKDVITTIRKNTDAFSFFDLKNLATCFLYDTSNLNILYTQSLQQNKFSNYLLSIIKNKYQITKTNYQMDRFIEHAICYMPTYMFDNKGKTSWNLSF